MSTVAPGRLGGCGNCTTAITSRLAAVSGGKQTPARTATERLQYAVLCLAQHNTHDGTVPQANETQRVGGGEIWGTGNRAHTA